MTTALVDMDIVAFRCAASCEKKEGGVITNLDPEEIALLRTDKLMRDIIEETGATGFLGFLSGQNNFRKEINKEYKANRKDLVKPIYLNSCKQFLMDEWQAHQTNGFEADDALGMHQDNTTIIASIDKDLLMIPGQHYNFVKKEFTAVSELEGLQSFYRSALIGDKVDNIYGVRGIGKVKASKLIDPLDSEKDMYNTCCNLYSDPDRLEMNLDCLWIFRNLNERWSDRFAF